MTHGENSEYIREVQNMLRTVGFYTGEERLVIPENGTVDAETLRAVETFRVLSGLDAFGGIDTEFYEKLRKAYKETLFYTGKTAAVRPYPERDGYELMYGETSELVFILQLMLNAIRLYYDLTRIPLSGNFDDATRDAVCDFQRVNMLPVTGKVDRYTWERLAAEYNESVNDSQ